MAKESGLAWTTCTVDDGAGAAEAIVNDVVALDIGHPRGVFDWTGLDKSAHERGLGLADFSISLQVIFNDAASPSSHDCFKTVPSTSQLRTTTLSISGQAYATAPEVYYTDYPLSRGADGSFGATVPGVLGDGAVPAWT